MLTNSYLEYFLTLLGWVVNNGLWNILLSTGLFAAPLAFRLIGIWLKIREEGDDEGNKGALSIPRMEHAIYTSFLVMMSCCMPLMNVDLNTIKYDVSRAASCGTGVPNHPDDTGYSAVISSINEQTAAAPVWWYLIHKLAKGITQASVATIPCRPDMRQLRFEVQHTRISNKALAEELQDFTQDCYSLALYMWKRQDQGYTSDKAMLRDIEWIGSRTFLNSYYGGLQSKIPRAEFAWNEARDGGRPETGRGGYPTCREWWSNGETGLEARVIDQANPDLWTRLSAALNMAGGNANDYSEAVIRRLVSPESLTVSQGGHVYAGYGGNADFTLDNTVTRLAAIGGTALGSLAAFPAFDNLRQALPMIQAVLLMAIVVMVPLILAFSAYEFKTVITLTLVIFALNFLTFWWELARWLDSWLLTALYSSDTHSRFNMAGFQNSSDDLIMNFVMATMFLVLPAVWMGALSWAGIRVGTTLDGAFKSGSAKVEQSGGEGVNSLKKAGRL